MVWLLAIVAMLAVPVLSAMLPQWRVLPRWAAVSPKPIVESASPTPAARHAEGPAELPQNLEPSRAQQPSASAQEPAAQAPSPRPAMVPAEVASDRPARSWNWINALPLAWAVGFSVLMARLFAARLMLWNSRRQATVIGPSTHPTQATRDPIVAALNAVRSQLEIRQSVTVLIRPDKTIPVVWGIFRSTLLLPASARQWGAEQLRSVLLHELAHVKRRDTLAQLLTQIACAMHWFNPLVWVAAWRLGVERERACDDLVLASGVRPSAYAGHLLEVVAGLAPARSAQACGLAMARKSSLEGRLVAVLSGNLNRRGVSVALAAIALTIAGGVAVPIAMLRAADEKPALAAQPQAQPQAQKGKHGAMLKDTTEQKLQWGQTVNGLRMALAWPPSLGEPGMGDAQDFYLVVQNVSQAPVHLTANDAAPNPRSLVTREDGKIMSIITDAKPMPGDWLLAPRQAAFIRLLQPAEKGNDGKTVSALEEESIRTYPQYTLSAEMTIEKAPAGAWTGKLATGESRGSLDVIQPRNKDARALFKSWNSAARLDGKIPGALIGQLGDSVKTFTKNNPTWQTTPQLLKMLPRFDASHDWGGQEAAALLDELATLQDTPIAMALDNEKEGVIRTGTPLPPDLANAPWGEAKPNGLRMAWLLEPRTAEHRLGTPLKSRILIQNSGKVAVVFHTRTWHQGRHKAVDGKGAEIKVEAVSMLTRPPLLTFRLEPGEYVELYAPGIGVGGNMQDEIWQNANVASWIDAKAGDDVTVTTGPIELGARNEDPQLDGEPRWWMDFIRARLTRHLPFPDDVEARKLLLYRVAMELFGTPVGEDITSAFIADDKPDALDSLAKSLFHRPGLIAWAGPLQSAPTKFRVLPPDPDAAKKPRTAVGPGRYTLADNATLVVTRRPVGEQIVNEAGIVFSSPNPAAPAPPKVEVKLPDGYNTWAAAWIRGDKVLWVQQKSGIRSIDFTNPAQIRETTFEGPASFDKAPKPILDALRAELKTLDEPKPAAHAPPAATEAPK
ncbi:MAG TPA: M56 family metallopeptidase [Tepidisphaeraceae bacterium]|nr:M56 family metallopeptidase [Tepidisphaeraceae bacterium]